MSSTLPCACDSHAEHGICDEDCPCWGGIRSVTVATSGQFATVTHRVLLTKEKP